MPKAKVIGFRSNPEINAILGKYIDEHSKLKKQSQAIVAIIMEYPTLLSEIQRLKEKPSTIARKIEHKRPSLKPLIPLEFQASPMVSKEVDRLFRGQHSPLVEALCNVTKESVSRGFTVAGKRGIMIVIPTHNP